jgi:putative DNA methylase
VSNETFSRRNLPHWYMPAATHFVTFRLAGTLPREILDDLNRQKERLLRPRKAGQTEAQHREIVHKKLFAEYDDYLAAHREIDWLGDPRVAALIRRSLYFWNDKKYGLLAYCIMPNHVHLLIRPFDLQPRAEADWETLEPGEQPDGHSPLSNIMHSLKSYTAHQANEILSRSGPFWQHESYDHWVRDDEELARIVAYIIANPVKAGLAQRAWEFLWSSAHDRYLYDGDVSGWLMHNRDGCAETSQAVAGRRHSKECPGNERTTHPRQQRERTLLAACSGAGPPSRIRQRNRPRQYLPSRRAPSSDGSHLSVARGTRRVLFWADSPHL